MAERYWSNEAQQWEYRGGGGSGNADTRPRPTRSRPPVVSSTGTNPFPYGANPYGQDYGGRALGLVGLPGIEGRDVSNFIDPTPYLAAQTGVYNPETGRFEGGYQGAYQDLIAREDPYAVAVRDELLQAGRDVARESDILAGLTAEQAEQVAGYGPMAVGAATDAANQMRDIGQGVIQLGPEAVAAARAAAGQMGQQAQDLRGFADPAAGVLAGYGADQLGLYGSSFRPVEEQLAARALGYDTPARRAQEAAIAGADTARQIEAQRRSASRELARYGVDPSMGRGAQLIRDRVNTAAAIANARNQARRTVEQYADALRAGAANVGANVAGRGTGATQVGAGIGMQGATGAANIAQGAGNLMQAGTRTAADIGRTGANIAQGAGGLELQGIQTGANTATAAGNLMGTAADIGRQGAATGANVQTAGLGAGQATLPLLDRAAASNAAGIDAAQNWNSMITSSQGNRQDAPSPWAGVLQGLAGAAGNIAGSYLGARIPTGGSTNDRADGGYLYSTRQRFADGGGLMPAGIPATSWLINAPTTPVTGRADGGDLSIDPRCQNIGGKARMPDGTPCKIKVDGFADGGSFKHLFASVGTEPVAVIPPREMADGSAGGLVRGPGDGVSDSVPAVTDTGQQIRLSDKEYIIPEDVLRYKGQEFFDKLIAKHHVPAEAQRQGVLS